MIKTFCDSCEKETSVKQVQIPIHIIEFDPMSGYLDFQGNSVSGKSKNIDLCNKCINKFYNAGLKAIGFRNGT